MSEERPAVIWFNGKVVPWADAKVHVWSELAVRGASVFDGIRAFWAREEGSYYALALEEHVRRLFQSAKILRFPTKWTEDRICQGIFELVSVIGTGEPLFLRPTLFIEEGRYGFRDDDTVTGAYIVGFPLPRAEKVFTGIRCCVSSWRRANDMSIPPRVKAGAFYQGYRLSRVEAMERGYDDVIFMNDKNYVAETSNAALFIVRDGAVFTPPVTADILESVTRRRAIDLLRHEFHLPTEEREVNRTELYIADEVFSCGTLTEIQPVIEVDGLPVGDGRPGPVTARLRERYFAICESGAAAPTGWLTAMPPRGEK